MTDQGTELGDLIEDVRSNRLILQPPFQRRQVWTNEDKEFLIDTVLRGYPFPEIFVCTGSRRLDSPARTRWLVDGQQRLSTLVDYRYGVVNQDGTKAILCKKVVPFAELPEDQQKRFDEYRVVVRDLAARPESEIREIFRRINATDYSLKQVEKLNAMFSGAYQRYCHDLSKQSFFSRHKVFRKSDVSRMKDVTFCTTLVTTLLSTYFRRDEENAQFLERYNEEFPQATSVQQGLDLVFSFIEDGGFPDKCRVWGQTHLFTLIVELHQILVKDRRPLDAVACGQSLTQFYLQVEAVHHSASEDEGKHIESRVFRYYQAALKATNEKYTRVTRGEVIAEVLLSAPPPPTATKPKRVRKKR